MKSHALCAEILKRNDSKKISNKVRDNQIFRKKRRKYNFVKSPILSKNILIPSTGVVKNCMHAIMRL